MLSEQAEPLLLAGALEGLMGCSHSAFNLKLVPPVSELRADNDTASSTEVQSKRTTFRTKYKTSWQVSKAMVFSQQLLKTNRMFSSCMRSGAADHTGSLDHTSLHALGISDR